MAERSDSRRPRVLIATASVGAGHNSVARTLADSLSRTGAPIDLYVVDVMDCTPAWFQAYYAGGFRISMSRFPTCYGLGFRLSNRPHCPGRKAIERPRLAFERAATAGYARYVRRLRPDLIVNTHFLAPLVVDRMNLRGPPRFRQVMIVTDIETHRRWYAETIGHWFVPTDCTAGILRRWGIPDEQMTVSGIPVHEKWTRPLDRAKVLADWDLPGDRDIVVLSGGTDFVCGPIADIARRVARDCPRAYVVVLGGRNKELIARVAALDECPDRVRPVSFTDRVHELVGVCALMITKAGGITTAECISRGTPMVLMRPVPGQERGNALYFAARGAAEIAMSAAETVDAVRGLLSDKSRRDRMSRAAKALYRPATRTVTDRVLSTVL